MTQPKVSDAELIREAYFEVRQKLEYELPNFNPFRVVDSTGGPILASLYVAMKLSEEAEQ